MALNIGPEGATVRQGQPLADDNKDWGKHEGVYTVPAGQTMTRFEFESVSAAGGNRSIGNFLDAIVFREPDSPIKRGQWLCEVMLDKLDPLVAGEALACRLEHDLREVEAHTEHVGTIDLQ